MIFENYNILRQLLHKDTHSKYLNPNWWLGHWCQGTNGLCSPCHLLGSLPMDQDQKPCFSSTQSWESFLWWHHRSFCLQPCLQLNLSPVLWAVHLRMELTSTEWQSTAPWPSLVVVYCQLRELPAQWEPSKLQTEGLQQTTQCRQLNPYHLMKSSFLLTQPLINLCSILSQAAQGS